MTLRQNPSRSSAWGKAPDMPTIAMSVGAPAGPRVPTACGAPAASGVPGVLSVTADAVSEAVGPGSGAAPSTRCSRARYSASSRIVGWE